MVDREAILRQAQSPEDKLLLAKILDKGNEVASCHEPGVTDFLDPHQQGLVRGILHCLRGNGCFFTGGYPGAERQRLVIYPDYLPEEAIESRISFIYISGNFKFQKVTHRDYLGSLLGLGLKREKFGDIIVLEDGAQVVADQQVIPYISQNLKKIHQVSVRIREIVLEELVLPVEKFKELLVTVASLRLDALVGEGFGISRGQAAKEIAGEKVKLNWYTSTNCAQTIGPGDVLSLRGKGRVVVEKVTGETRKGRIGLVLKRYL